MMIRHSAISISPRSLASVLPAWEPWVYVPSIAVAIPEDVPAIPPAQNNPPFGQPQRLDVLRPSHGVSNT